MGYSSSVRADKYTKQKYLIVIKHFSGSQPGMFQGRGVFLEEREILINITCITCNRKGRKGKYWCFFFSKILLKHGT